MKKYILKLCIFLAMIFPVFSFSNESLENTTILSHTEYFFGNISWDTEGYSEENESKIILKVDYSDNFDYKVSSVVLTDSKKPQISSLKYKIDPTTNQGMVICDDECLHDSIYSFVSGSIKMIGPSGKWTESFSKLHYTIDFTSISSLGKKNMILELHQKMYENNSKIQEKIFLEEENGYMLIGVLNAEVHKISKSDLIKLLKENDYADLINNL